MAVGTLSAQCKEVMTVANYNSSTLVPSAALERFKERASTLHISALSLAKQIISLAEEAGDLPGSIGVADGARGDARFPFSLSHEFVDRVGGQDRARELLRWAIVEGLDQSPLAAPED